MHDVLIVGGGNAGISLAAYLRRAAKQLSVAVVAPGTEHRYRPLLSYVGGGLCPEERTRRRQARLIPPGVRWYRDHVDRIEAAGASEPEPAAMHRVTTRQGTILHGRDLVLCPGTRIDWDAIPGSWQACQAADGSSNYDPELAPKTWRVLSGLRSGNAVFVVSDRNTPCPGVGLKPLFLAADHWQRQGRLSNIDITLIMESTQPFGLDRVDRALREQLKRLQVAVHPAARVEAIDPDQRTVRFVTADGRHQRQDYDALHLAPPHRGHPWLDSSGLTDPDTTLVKNDPQTLQHLDHPGVWALGDAATLHSPSSGGGLRHQVPVLAHNILARRTGAVYRRYNGYTVAPIPIDRGRLLLAERDRHGAEVRTLPVLSLARPSRALFAFDLLIQPEVYWGRLLRGRGLAD